MFKVQKTEYVNKTFRMPLNLVTEMEKVAQNTGVSLNNLVIQCRTYALGNMEKENSEK